MSARNSRSGAARALFHSGVTAESSDHKGPSLDHPEPDEMGDVDGQSVDSSRDSDTWRFGAGGTGGTPLSSRESRLNKEFTELLGLDVGSGNTSGSMSGHTPSRMPNRNSSHGDQQDVEDQEDAMHALTVDGLVGDEDDDDSLRSSKAAQSDKDLTAQLREIDQGGGGTRRAVRRTKKDSEDISAAHTPRSTTSDDSKQELSSLSQMAKGELQVHSLSLLYDPPVEDCELKPYVLLRNALGKKYTSDKTGDKEVVFRWLRGQKRVCSLPRCTNGASFQCLSCIKLKIPAHMAYFCSQRCQLEAWPHHRNLHRKHLRSLPEKEQCVPWHYDDDEVLEREQEEEDAALRPQTGTSPLKPRSLKDTPTALACHYPPKASNVWGLVQEERNYTPQQGDVGRSLRLEVAPVQNADDVNEQPILGAWKVWETSGVLPAPLPPPPRNVLFLKPQINVGIKTICYNVLADIYANGSLYSYCPMWALAWDFRKHVLLRDIISHQADLIALQEVQADHFENWFQPNLSAAGYEGIYKRKTRQPFGDNPNAIDGCAIFFKRDRFALTEKYGIEFDDIARRVRRPREQLRRMTRGNVALVVVLEELTTGRRRRRKLCFVNTHIYWDPEFAEVKLWQTWVLCKELEKLVLRRNLPLLLCGDFNSTVDSSVYELLTTKGVRSNHRVFTSKDADPTGVLPPPAQLVHHLPLSSAYAAIGEPKFTNFTGHFVGVLDYVLYSKTHMQVVSVLDVDEREVVAAQTALPSPQFPSDHCALACQLDWLQVDE